MIHYYYGYGKGKTSAAAGACLRAVSAGRKCAVVQFHKDGSSGETVQLKRLGIDIYACFEGVGFFGQLNDEEKEKLISCHNDNLRKAADCGYDLIVLDELGDALSNNSVDVSLVEKLLKASGCELIITGHKPVELFMRSADYITEFRCEAHPFAKGIEARKGIEY